MRCGSKEGKYSLYKQKYKKKVTPVHCKTLRRVVPAKPSSHEHRKKLYYLVMNEFHIPAEELQWPEEGSTVAVGLSGGVDSASAALMLKERGCTVVGITMSSWNNDLPLPPSKNGVRNSCYGADEKIDMEQCAEFCKTYGIKYYVIDVREAYKAYVMDYFKSEYRAGRTPNPCVHCNARVKFAALVNGARAQGVDFDYFCTGHYASLVRPLISVTDIYRALGAEFGSSGAQRDGAGAAGPAGTEEGRGQSYTARPVMVSAAQDTFKDQTYFLHRIPSDVLERTRFPLSGFTKKAVFEFAREHGLKAALRSESQDFISSEYFNIIFSDKKSTAGDIVDIHGVKLGEHRGIEHYTIGQRRGLGVSANKPLYVRSIDSVNNRIVLADENELFSAGLEADSWVWAGNYAPAAEFEASVKIRLASPAAPARIIPLEGGAYRILFEKPQRAVAPGQSAVVYADKLILGGGVISRTIEL